MRNIGSAQFKDSVEKLYKGAPKNYSEVELSSWEFSLASAQDDEHVYKVAASETDFRGLEEIYSTNISQQHEWAVQRVVTSQGDKGLRKQLPEIAATVSTRSKILHVWLHWVTPKKQKKSMALILVETARVGVINCWKS